MSHLRTLGRNAWAIARPYWFSDDRWVGRALLVVVVALTLGFVYINATPSGTETARFSFGR